MKAPKKERRKEQMTVFLLQCGEKTAVHKRGETGLLSGLWEFPNVPGTLTCEEALAQAEAWGCGPAPKEGDGADAGIIRKQTSAATEEKSRTHVFTHVEWEMKCYHVNCTKMPEIFAWANIPQIKAQYALPTAFRKFL